MSLSLAQRNIFNWSKFYALADVKINVTQIVNVVHGQKNIDVIGENDRWFPAFSSFPTVFSKILSRGHLNSGLYAKSFYAKWLSTESKLTLY